MYGTKEALEKFRRQLNAMPHDLLVDTITEYASGDTNLWMHLLVVANLHAKNNDQDFNQVKEQIDRVYGDDDIPQCLEHDQKLPFYSVQELIAQLLTAGMAQEAARACEHAFTYGENIAGVTWPDVFIGDCYDSIVDTWIKSQKAMEISEAEMAKKVLQLEHYDGYGIFSRVEKRLSELGCPDAANTYADLRRAKSRK
jgi:hypothetical protein